MYVQGANASYDSVKKAALTLQIQDDIKDIMQEECGREQTATRRPVVHKKNDIIAIVSQLNANKEANCVIIDYPPVFLCQSCDLDLIVMV